MSLAARIGALERDIAQARRDRKLLRQWESELKTSQRKAAALESASHSNPRRGCDYSWGRPSVEELHSQGITFAGRYLTGGGKALARSEAVRLSQGRIALFSIYEEGAKAMLGGKIGGSHDGAVAATAARAIGMPASRPIYFAADWDVQPDEVDACLFYLEAAKAAMRGRYFAGVYGGKRLIEACRNKGFHYLYQTLAWSEGVRVPQAQIYQSGIAGSLDTDWAYAADFGQWTV